MTGPRSLGAIVAILTLAADQASKIWLLDGFDLASRQPYRLAPGVDLVLAWNRGVSYSLLTANGDTGRYLLIAGTLGATLLLAVWLWRTTTRLTSLALGLIIGGAVGNVVDRVIYGAVVDFVYLHAGTFRWYIFNVADCAITGGVILLAIEWLAPQPAQGAAKTP